MRDKSFGLKLLTRDPYDIVFQGTKQQLRYEAWVVFEFPDKYLATANFSEVQKTIGGVLASESASPQQLHSTAAGI